MQSKLHMWIIDILIAVIVPNLQNVTGHLSSNVATVQKFIEQAH